VNSRNPQNVPYKEFSDFFNRRQPSDGCNARARRTGVELAECEQQYGNKYQRRTSDPDGLNIHSTSTATLGTCKLVNARKVSGDIDLIHPDEKALTAALEAEKTAATEVEADFNMPIIRP
jgi:hypothetical protein